MSAREDGPIKCTWSANSNEKSPHFHKPRSQKPKIMDNILQNIGETPLVRLNRIPQSMGVECEVLCKCEFFNAGGSVKDRIGLRMIEDAERQGRIKPGDTLIEPTSGNTGIGLALAGAVKGYKVIITLPEKMSNEKVSVLKALGAEIIRTPTEAAFDSPESHIGVAQRLEKELPNAVILDQYANPSNPLAHYDGTAEEIIEATDGKVDCVVVGAGTGGTITGIARKIKEKITDCKIVGVDPKGSILAKPDSLNQDGVGTYHVEGIGYDFIPTVLDRDIPDLWIKTDDKDALIMARRLVREEGLLCGGSSGTAVVGAIEAAKRLGLGKGDRMVVILPDSIRNYITKFVSDAWMNENRYIDSERGIGVNEVDPKVRGAWWAHLAVTALPLETPLTIGPSVSCEKAVQVLKEHGIDQLPVVGQDGVMGVVTEGNLLSLIAKKRVLPTDPVTKGLYKQFRSVTPATTLAELSQIFDRDHFALIVHTQSCVEADAVTQKEIVTGIVTRIDLLNFITQKRE